MDPNETLKMMLAIARAILHEERTRKLDPEGEHLEDEANELAELVEAMDGWLSKGGFLPERWSDGRPIQGR